MKPRGSSVHFGALLLSAFTFVSATTASGQSQKPNPLYDATKHQANVKILPHSAIKPNVTGSDGSSCTLITFEGLGDLAAIPVFQGIRMPDWLSVISDQVGGEGNFANEPSPVTIAFWLYGNPTSQTIDIPNGATSMSLYYSSAYSITLTGYDAKGNVVATATGDPNYDSSTGVYDIWSQLTVTATSGSTIASLAVAGYANYTGIDNLNVCQSPTIASVEVTQAIQQYQTLDDLKTSLSANGQPPVPVIANKPAVLRTYLNPVQDVTDVTINLTGVSADTGTLTLQPNCTPHMQRAEINGCQSIDFYFTPPAGGWTATLNVTDASGNVVETEDLNFSSVSTDSMRLRGVTVCDAQDTTGMWLCADASNILGKTDLLAKIVPTASLTTDVTTDVVHLNSAAYTDGMDWWIAAAKAVDDNFGKFDFLGDYLSDRRTTYFGMVRPVSIGGLAGLADGIPSHGALSLISEPWAGTDISDGTVAHETGHTLGLRHTNTAIPYLPGGPPGCFALRGAQDSLTDWSFPTGTPASASNTNYIQSPAVSGTPTYEVGFDVAAGVPIDPNSNFEVMSYCAPYWISPQRYNTMIGRLNGATTSTAATNQAKAKTDAVPATTSAKGSFWQVRGSISGSSAVFGPLFEYNTTGDTGADAGTYSLQVLSISDTVLFTRNFTPTPLNLDTPPGSTANTQDASVPDVFSELIPVSTGAAAIVLNNSSGTEIGRITLSGAPPTVAIVTPSSGFIGTGTEAVTWTVAGPASFTSKILYSSDNGATWAQVGEVANAETFPVNFNAVAGSNQALIRVLVSDGVNTGSATSTDFTVPRKKPSQAQIHTPLPNFAQPAKRPVYLSGSVYDEDDGVLSGTALTWTSNLQGELGTGSPLSVKLKPGNHTVTFTGTDSDGNKISTSTKITMGGAPPVVSLQVQALNSVPTTCEYATVNATPGTQGANLSLVQYSVDGGSTYTTVPLTALPYGFVVPGSGFLHLVARAYDISGQSNAQDVSFLTQSSCTLTSQTITFGALPNTTYGASPITLTATASSGLPVTYTVTGPATVSGSTLTITGAGMVVVTAAQKGNATFAPADLVSHSFGVAKAVLTATAANLSRQYDTANPALTYRVTGFVNRDTSSVLSGTATLTTTATTTSQPGTYPITFITEALTAANYSFTYVAGALTVTSNDTTAPTVSLTGEVAGPPKNVIFSSQDNKGGSGLASVVVTKCTNCTSSTTPFAKGTSSVVTTTATKTNQSLSSSVKIVASDVAGNSTTFDPVDLQLESKGRPTKHLVNINSKENIVLISNGKPGMSWMQFDVNGNRLPVINLSSGESTTVDIGRYLLRGRGNRVLVIADGKEDATIWIIFTQP